MRNYFLGSLLLISCFFSVSATAALPEVGGYVVPRGGAFFMSLGYEANDAARLGSLQSGYRFRGAAGELSFTAKLLWGVHGTGSDGVDGDVDDNGGGGGLRMGVSYSAPWRIAPFADLNYDLGDAVMSDLAAEGEDETDYDWAVGIQFRLDEHLSFRTYHRVYRTDDGTELGLFPGVNRKDRASGVAIGWDF